MKNYAEIRKFFCATISIVCGLVGSFALFASVWKYDIQYIILGICFLTYSEVIWLEYRINSKIELWNKLKKNK